MALVRQHNRSAYSFLTTARSDVMVIVIGSAIARADTDEAMQRLALEHVLRSRSEPGCLSHEVSHDVAQPPMTQLSDGKLTMELYQADAVTGA
jgi:quinol monooxygenase YgiN